MRAKSTALRCSVMLLQNGYCRDMRRSSAGLKSMVQKCVRQWLVMVLHFLVIEMLQLFSNMLQCARDLFHRCVGVFINKVPGILYCGASCVFSRHTSTWVVFYAITFFSNKFVQSWHIFCELSFFLPPMCFLCRVFWTCHLTCLVPSQSHDCSVSKSGSKLFHPRVGLSMSLLVSSAIL